MSKKKPLVIGNWKMELSHKGEISLAKSLVGSFKGKKRSADVVVCPSFPSLSAVQTELKKVSNISIGAQNIFWDEKGAWTGQTSLPQVQSFISWCLLGHSEVRAVLGVTDAQVAALAGRLLGARINPVICIGETAQERAADATVEKIRTQVDVLLESLHRTELVRVVIAYEPIWAIGTGELPDPDDVAQVILFIRKHIAARYDQDYAERMRILYGGSIKADFAKTYVGGPLADGLLVGGASIHPQQFSTIVSEVEHVFAP